MAGVVGTQVTGLRLTWALVVFAALVIAGMAITYRVDRSTRIASETADVKSVTDGSGAAAPLSGAPAPPTAPVATTGSADARCKDAWVSAVMAFSDIQDPDFRRRLLRKMGDNLHLEGPFEAMYSAMARDHVVEIVNSCWAYERSDEARRALADALTSLRPNTRAAANLRRLPQSC